MGTLISYATSEAQIRGVGVFIREIAPPGVVQGASSGTVALVGEFPWGPTGRYEPTSVADLRDTMFGPAGQGHPAWVSLYGKRFGRVIVSRVEASDAAAATVTVQDEEMVPADSLIATARCKSKAGDGITLVIDENADDPDVRDVTVSFVRADGTTYSATYEAVQADDGAVTDPGDPFVAFAADVGASKPCEPGTYQLAGGSDGTVSASDYAAALTAIGGVSSPAEIVVTVEPSSAVTDTDVNGALATHASENPQQIVILKTPAGESVSAALSDVAGYQGDNIVRLWPQVHQRAPQADGSLAKTQVDGNTFAAAMMAGTDPWISPGTRQAAELAEQIVDLEDTTLGSEAYASLLEGGISPWFMGRAGAMLRGATCTDGTRIRARRYATYVQMSIAQLLEDYVDTPLDLDLAERAMGPNTSGQIGAIRQFLVDERTLGHLVAFEIDPFGAMTPAKFSAGRWDIEIRVQDVPGAEQIVIRHQQGPSVQV